MNLTTKIIAKTGLFRKIETINHGTASKNEAV